MDLSKIRRKDAKEKINRLADGKIKDTRVGSQAKNYEQTTILERQHEREYRRKPSKCKQCGK
jgi:hypothetical protein